MAYEIKIAGGSPDRELAREWRAARAPSPDMEARLIAEFRAHQKNRKGRQFAWWTLAAAALVALLAVNSAVLRKNSPVAPDAPVLLVQSQQPAIGDMDSGLARLPLPAVKNKATRKLARTPAAAVEATLASRSESYTEFFPIANNFSSEQLDRGQVIRVQLPRSSLFAIGMPVDVNRLDESVKADLVMGEDGIARAVRFVQ